MGLFPSLLCRYHRRRPRLVYRKSISEPIAAAGESVFHFDYSQHAVLLLAGLLHQRYVTLDVHRVVLTVIRGYLTPIIGYGLLTSCQLL